MEGRGRSDSSSTELVEWWECSVEDARVAVKRAAGTPLALDKAHGSDSGLESGPSVIKILRNLNLVLHRAEFSFSPQHLSGGLCRPRVPTWPVTSRMLWGQAPGQTLLSSEMSL